MKLNINNGKLFFCLPSSSSVLIQQRASRDHKHRIAQLLVKITAHIPFANVYIPYQKLPGSTCNVNNSGTTFISQRTQAS